MSEVANLHNKNILFMYGDQGYSINTHLKNSLTTALYYNCFILMDKVRALISSTSCLLCNNIVLFFESSSSTLWETVSLLTFLPLTVCYSVRTYKHIFTKLQSFYQTIDRWSSYIGIAWVKSHVSSVLRTS